MARLLRFLFGCALGATVAVLVTPKSGRAVRQQLLSAARPVLLTRGPDEDAEPQDEQPWARRAEPAAEEPAAAAAVSEEAASEWFPASDAASMVVAPEEPAWEWFPTEPAASEPAAVEEAPAAEEAPVPEESLVIEEAPAAEEPPAAEEAPVAEESLAIEEPPAEAVADTPRPAELEDLRMRIAAARESLGSAIAQPARTPPTSEWFVAPEVFEAAPEVEQPAPEEPVAEEPVLEETALEMFLVKEPPVEEAAPEEVAPEVLETEPEVEQPAPEEPVTEEAAPESAFSEQTEVEEAAPEELAPEELAVEEPIAEETVPEESWLEEPPLEMFLVKEPPAEPRAAYEPPTVDELHVAEDVAPEGEAPVEEPAAEAAPSPDSAQPEAQTVRPVRESSIDPAEMRRRIEETRARLKAKAFDAMMSGEAALLSRDSGESSVPREADVGVGDDVAQTIEEGLSEDDS